MSGQAAPDRAAAVGGGRAIARVPRQARYTAFGPDVPERESVLLAFGERLRALRVAAGLSQAALALRCFMRRNQISAIECGTGTLDLPDLLVVAQRLGVSAGGLIDGLEAPVRRIGTAQVLDVVARQPGISADALATSLGLPPSYADEIAFYLQSIGAIASERAGWRPAAEMRPGESGER